MSMKKVQIGGKPTAKTAPTADAWVESRSPVAEADQIAQEQPEKMKRLTIDVPEELHRKIKTACAQRGTKIADEVRELLLQTYGNH